MTLATSRLLNNPDIDTGMFDFFDETGMLNTFMHDFVNPTLQKPLQK